MRGLYASVKLCFAMLLKLPLLFHHVLSVRLYAIDSHFFDVLQIAD